MAVAPQINEFLGVEEEETSTQMLTRLRDGLPFQAIENIRQALELSLDELAEALAISARTLSRRKKSDMLAPAESDRVYRIARVFAHAVDVFGDREKAAQWFKTANPTLDDMAPLAVFDTDLGTQLVDDVLTRIEFGVYS